MSLATIHIATSVPNKKDLVIWDIRKASSVPFSDTQKMKFHCASYRSPSFQLFSGVPGYLGFLWSSPSTNLCIQREKEEVITALEDKEILFEGMFVTFLSGPPPCVLAALPACYVRPFLSMQLPTRFSK